MEWLTANWLPTVIILVAVTLSIYVIVSYKKGTLLKKAPLEVEEQKAHPHRELNVDEKDKLLFLVASSQKMKKYKLILILMGTIVLISGCTFFALSTYGMLSVNMAAVLFPFGLVLGIILIIAAFSSDISYRQYTNDLHSQVYKVVGKLIYSHKYSYMNTSFIGHGWISVAGESFNRYTQFQGRSLEDSLEQIDNNDIVEIEYSPHSMHIWRVTKLNS